MKSVLEKLKSEVQTNPARFYSDTVEPILDTLYCHDFEAVGIETSESKIENANFSAALGVLPIDQNNEIDTLMDALYASYAIEEAAAKEVLITFEDEYPNVRKEDSLTDIFNHLLTRQSEMEQEDTAVPCGG